MRQGSDEGKSTAQIYPELRDGVRKDKEMGPNPHKQPCYSRKYREEADGGRKWHFNEHSW